jgi:hypothetical protein
VAVYLDFLTGLTLDECDEYSEEFRSVFEAHTSLGAILFFTEVGVARKQQCYGFLCLCRDSFLRHVPGWPLQPGIKYTFCV